MTDRFTSSPVLLGRDISFLPSPVFSLLDRAPRVVLGRVVAADMGCDAVMIVSYSFNWREGVGQPSSLPRCLVSRLPAPAPASGLVPASLVQILGAAHGGYLTERHGVS
eukprot:sb/3477475/